MSAEWLDKPDGDGWWWRISILSPPDLPEIGIVKNGMWSGQCLRWALSLAADLPENGVQWQRVQPHTPVPKPLPKTREVRAVVTRDEEGDWVAQLCLGERCLRTVYAKDDSRDAAVAHCREVWGLEPEIVK